jgi:hypothetical protein
VIPERDSRIAWCLINLETHAEPVAGVGCHQRQIAR